MSTGLQRRKLALDARPIGLARDAHIHLGPRLGRNHVGLAAAAGRAHAHRQSALQIRPAAHRFHRTRQLQQCARAFLKVHARVRRDALRSRCASCPCPCARSCRPVPAPAPAQTRLRIPAASRSVIGRDTGLPISSSLFSSSTISRSSSPASVSISIAVRAIATPPSYPACPGPTAVPRASGRACVFSVPNGHTVSRCPSSSTRSLRRAFDFGPNRASSTSPNALCRCSFTRPPSPFACGRSKRDARVHCCLVVRGRFGQNQFPRQVEQGAFLAPRTGQQRAHRYHRPSASGFSVDHAEGHLRDSHMKPACQSRTPGGISTLSKETAPKSLQRGLCPGGIRLSRLGDF